MVFGKRIRELRKARGFALNVTAAYCGISKGYLSGIETGKVRPPLDRIVRKIAILYEQDAAGLLKLAYYDKLPSEVRDSCSEALLPKQTM